MAEYIKRTDVMKICEEYSQHCFNSGDARGQDIADRILDDVVEIPTADVVEVVRCPDCIYCENMKCTELKDNTGHHLDVAIFDYCSQGVPRERNERK